MRYTVDIEWEDEAQAARWLAGYMSRLYEHPGLSQVIEAEFPLADRLACPIDTREIARQAALALYERFCTDAGREKARRDFVRRGIIRDAS